MFELLTKNRMRGSLSDATGRWPIANHIPVLDMQGFVHTLERLHRHMHLYISKFDTYSLLRVSAGCLADTRARHNVGCVLTLGFCPVTLRDMISGLSRDWVSRSLCQTGIWNIHGQSTGRYNRRQIVGNVGIQFLTIHSLSW